MGRRWGWMAATCLMACASTAVAADQSTYGPGDPTAALPPASSTSSPLQIPIPAPEAPDQSETTLFTLTSVRFEGAIAVNPSALETTWRPLVGRPVSFVDLRRIGREAELIYAAAGYPFVAILLTPQEVLGGAVTFRVVEGHISDLSVLGLDPVARRQVTDAFQPLVGRTPLPMSAVEVAYETARQIPGLSLAGALRRGSEAGGMDLVIQARRKTWRAYANLNNSYSDAVGPWGALAGIDYNGTSRFGDRTSLQVYSTTDLGEQAVLKLNHSRVLNRYGTSVEIQAVRAWASPQAAVAPLDLATDVISASVLATQPLMVRGLFSLRGHAGLEGTNQETRVFSSIRLTNDHLRIATLGLDAQWRGERLQWLAGLEVRKGLDIAGASAPGDIDLSRFGADPQALVFRADLQGDLGLPLRFALNVRAIGQFADTSLTAPEEFSLGNLTIGRGYDPGSSFGDSALAAAIELRAPAFAVASGLTAQPFGFYDTARVWNHEFGAPDNRTVSSFGGGVRLEATGRFQLTLTYAAPQTAPLGFGEPTPGSRLLVNLTVGIPEVFRGLGRASDRGAN